MVAEIHAIVFCVSGYGLVVERVLAKDEAGFRLPLSAPISNRYQLFLFFDELSKGIKVLIVGIKDTFQTLRFMMSL